MIMRITERQLEGAIVIIVVSVVIYTATFNFSQLQVSSQKIPFGDISSGPVIVAIAGNTDFNGIYYMFENARICDLLKSAGVINLEKFDEKILYSKLSTGDAVVMESDNQLRIDQMNNANKVAFNIPININKATLNDLILIPGIGEKTAWQIIQFREESGSFKKLEDLMKIRGIKEKKFTKVKRYLCANKIS